MSSAQPSFSLRDLEYDLPTELIAQSPLPRRDDSRMLVVRRSDRSLRDAGVAEFPSLLQPDDLLVLNDTRVLPARFTAVRRTGGKVGGLFLEEAQPGVWEVMLEGSRRLKPEEVLHFRGREPEFSLTLVERLAEGRWTARVMPELPAAEVLAYVGSTPLPPYIHRSDEALDFGRADVERYQTVYARNAGAVAAPTAGLHLSNELLARIQERGVHIAFVTLHVGLGTFKPISALSLADHVMHHERFEIPDESVAAWNECRRRGGRVVAIGTTVVRVLESVLGLGKDASIRRGSTNLFAYPPYQVSAVDALLTNFHLPQSTLLALVMAFAGVDLTRTAYAHAISRKYRFFSYGDAMFLE